MEGLIQSHYYFSDGQPRKEGDHDEAGELVEPYYEKWERRWLDSEGDDTTLKRYMRAGKGNEQDAIKRLEVSIEKPPHELYIFELTTHLFLTQSTLHWRRSFKPDIIPPEDIRIEGETGKHILCGFDNDGRPILYLIPRHENTKSSDRQIRYVVWGLERTLDILPPGQTKVTLAIDFFNSTQATNPNMATSRKVLSILQNHYVERLGSALCIRPPWWMNAFYTAIQPFVDPVTKQKVKWNTDLKEFVPPSHLLKEYGGEYDFEFDKEITWSDILDFTGVAPDGTRLHESFAKMTEDEERRIRSGESLPATAASAKKQQDQRTQPIANGHTVNDDLQDDDDDEDDEDDEKPQFHDAQETISRSSAITVTQ